MVAYKKTVQKLRNLSGCRQHFEKKTKKNARAISREKRLKSKRRLFKQILWPKIHIIGKFHWNWSKIDPIIQIAPWGGLPITLTLTLFRYRHLDITQKLKFELLWNLKCMFITSIVTHKQNFRPLAWKKILHVQMRAGAPILKFDILNYSRTKFIYLSNC